ncbi:SRPBCC family protein [Nocardioides sp. W7]|uniref:SRPBCC family protein n=1 Tax=Nocardioides sp. W7 TaxID=2931390 RepID=UPI001FD56465|nr:SRPBCC family protein [Nocardioides sp. W7]
MSASYSFAAAWHLDASPEAVRDVVVDLERYPEWWPQVVAVAKLGADDAWVRCRSTLPYTLDLVLHAVARELPVLEVAVSGDLSGEVRFVLSPSYDGTMLRLEQEVSVTGLLGVLSPLARPVLEWNHDRMMRGCVSGLRRRLACGPPRPAR